MELLRKGATLILGLSLLCSGALGTLQAAGQQDASFSIKVGVGTASVNGTSQAIISPYQIKGVTMVPLGLFKKAFGAQIRLEDGNQVKLSLGKHTILLTISNPLIRVDGHNMKSEVAPAMLHSTLMVPLRMISSGLGATVSVGSKGDIRVTHAQEDTDEDGVEGLGSEAGKTKMGNSYYGWTLQYPSGLIPGQSDDDSVATFTDVANSYYFEVHAGMPQPEEDPASLLDQLLSSARNGGETVLDQSISVDTKVPFARIIARDNEGVYWQERAYYGNGRIYTLYLSVMNVKSYKDLNAYDKLLNTFQPSFNKEDPAIKDLSQIKDGLIEQSNDDYGMTFKIPAEWSKDNSKLTYQGKDGTSLQMSISSAVKGQSAEQWSQEVEQWMQQRYIESAYHSLGKALPIQIAKVPGVIQSAEFTNGATWFTQQRVSIINKGYRYLFSYTEPKVISSDTQMDKGTGNSISSSKTLSENAQAPNTPSKTFKIFLDSLDIDYAGNAANYGHIEDNQLLSDTTVTALKSSDAYQYTIAIPRYWTPVNDRFESNTVEYSFTGGSFKLNADKTTDPDLAIWQLRSLYAEAARTTKGFILDGVDSTKIAGQEATVFHIRQISNGISTTKQVILLSRNGIAYKLTTSISDVNNTAEQKAAITKALDSFKLKN
ncbi:hypothetical protein J2Z69_002795 [Paenibacillus shirakamiensis]|uniref:Copper amine oxidase-like N-terminal domain-containing protein n=1 Tax=Paenibacillus shirakamiensis TaxID=1265935 RepID=A0ABS4JJ62_9BACL|nr:copper amine oxidase N-terminal domain-containing protein [Paenibacillus shirakamiensis]MBP2001739.1 hypothetical protein [Paenibacillus shirakamiensis]